MNSPTLGPRHSNSVDKIVKSYFVAFAYKNFEYNGKIIECSKVTTISPLLWRGYTCPAGCGGCCSKFSLAYLPSEKHPYPLTQRMYSFNGENIEIFEDTQKENADRFCKNLKKEDGRCGIHGSHPFSCDFELIRMLTSEGNSWVGTRLYGRGWKFLKVDGNRGAICTITPRDEASRQDVIRKLRRLKEWMDHCKIPNFVDLVINHGLSEQFMNKLVITKEAK